MVMVVLGTTFYNAIANENAIAKEGPQGPQGCIVNIDTGQKYCLPVGQRSPYSLPEYVYNKPVYVDAPEGTGVMLSDWDNLSYNRIATFVGTVTNAELKSVKAQNGKNLDFSHPRSMRVVNSTVPLGCIISTDMQEKYCLPAGKRSPYSLPKFIYNKPVYVNAPEGTGVMLSDWDNLSYNHIATFVGTVTNAELKSVKAQNGENLDFSHPHSMRVVESTTPLGCIISTDMQEKYCLPAGKRSPYSLPKYIYDKPVNVNASEGTGVMLCDWDNLSYNHLATFVGVVPNEQLKHVKAQNGKYLDFSHPHSMRVVESN